VQSAECEIANKKPVNSHDSLYSEDAGAAEAAPLMRRSFDRPAARSERFMTPASVLVNFLCQPPEAA
ncbi:MAG TPA: hypothetical protein VFK58_02830, partial [Sphingomicrobium sp.]|nr:hypothetical protein [Sphingomicrobium sp.]